MTKRKDYITFLSVISAFAVVVLHTNGCFWSFSKERYWFTANIIESVFYFAVPIFFMITGVNLIDYQKKYSTKEYFKKRIKKTVIPFLCWNALGLMYLIQKKYVSIQSIDIKYIFNGFFNSPFITIYWFFITLFGMYLCIPLFSSVDDNKKNNIFSYLVITSFIVQSLIPFIISVFNLKIYFGIVFGVCSGCLIYPLIGYLIDNNELKPSIKTIIYLFGIIGLLMHIIGTYKLSYNANDIIKTYKGYYNVPCILYSTSVFVFVKELRKKTNNGKIINCISKYTFAIYLLHWFVMDIIIRVTSVNTHSIFFRLGSPFIIIPICMLLTYIIRKIPILKHIVP